jgi:hypothetical protein
VERSSPYVTRARTNHALEPRFHLACGFIRKSDGKDAIGCDAQFLHQVRDAVRDDARLPAARAGKY